MNVIHTLAPSFFKIKFNIIPPPICRSSFSLYNNKILYISNPSQMYYMSSYFILGLNMEAEDIGEDPAN
jgi:hypothetical protein